MNIEVYTISGSMILYLITGIAYAMKHNWPWAIIWFAYAIAQAAMIWAAKAGTQT